MENVGTLYGTRVLLGIVVKDVILKVILCLADNTRTVVSVEQIVRALEIALLIKVYEGVLENRCVLIGNGSVGGDHFCKDVDGVIALYCRFTELHHALGGIKLRGGDLSRGGHGKGGKVAVCVSYEGNAVVSFVYAAPYYVGKSARTHTSALYGSAYVYAVVLILEVEEGAFLCGGISCKVKITVIKYDLDLARLYVAAVIPDYEERCSRGSTRSKADIDVFKGYVKYLTLVCRGVIVLRSDDSSVIGKQRTVLDNDV